MVLLPAGRIDLIPPEIHAQWDEEIGRRLVPLVFLDHGLDLSPRSIRHDESLWMAAGFREKEKNQKL